MQNTVQYGLCFWIPLDKSAKVFMIEPAYQQINEQNTTEVNYK